MSNQRNPPIMHVLAVALMLIGFGKISSASAFVQDSTSGPWTQKQAAQPNVLAAMLSKKSGVKPVILQVGFEVLYRSKHIPHSIYAGPASTPEGLQKLKKAVSKLPKNADIYIYCGCCPIGKCPNIRPAFQALQAMGFTHLHVLMLETNFGKDWVAHGYPVAGESSPSK